MAKVKLFQYLANNYSNQTYLFILARKGTSREFVGTLLLEYFNSIVCPTNIKRLRFDETAWQTCHRQCGCSLISRWSRGIVDRDRRDARHTIARFSILLIPTVDPFLAVQTLFGLCPYIYIYIHECHRTIELLWDRHADSVELLASLSSLPLPFASSSIVAVVVVVYAMSLFHDSAASVSLTDFGAQALPRTRERGERKRDSRRARENHEKTVYARIGYRIRSVANIFVDH